MSSLSRVITAQPDLFKAYSQGVADCSYPWEFQADVGSEQGPKTYRYHPGLGYFVPPAPGGGFETIMAPGWDTPRVDMLFLEAALTQGYDVKLYAWNRTTRVVTKVFFNSNNL